MSVATGATWKVEWLNTDDGLDVNSDAFNVKQLVESRERMEAGDVVHPTPLSLTQACQFDGPGPTTTSIEVAWQVVKELRRLRALTISHVALSPDGEEPGGVWIQWAAIGLFCVIEANGEIYVDSTGPPYSSIRTSAPRDAALRIQEYASRR
jgi:hypothetical protein